MLASEEILNPKFKLLNKIGSGSYGNVYRGYYTLNKEIYAIKCINRSLLKTSTSENIIDEITILKRLSHPNIIKMIDFSWDGERIYIIMELCQGGDLASLLQKPFPETFVQNILSQIKNAFTYMFSLNISHFDLKPSNILLKYPFQDHKSFILKIGDFGLAKCIQNNTFLTNIRGSFLYMAPEIIIKQKYDAKADLWSIGIIMFECLYGFTPYSSHSYDELFQKILSPTPIILPSNPSVTKNCSNLLLRLLQKDPDCRISFEEFFMHPYITMTYLSKREQSLEHGKTILINAEYYLDNAIIAEKLLNFQEALFGYINAANTLMPILNIETNSHKKAKMREFISCIIDRAEKIKTDLNLVFNSSLNIKEPIQENNLDHTNDDSKFNNDSQISSAIKLVELATLYQKKGDPKSLQMALDKIEICINVLLKKLKQYNNNTSNNCNASEIYDLLARWTNQKNNIRMVLDYLNLKSSTGEIMPSMSATFNNILKTNLSPYKRMQSLENIFM